MTTITITVTQEHINRAVAAMNRIPPLERSDTCPVALAISKALGVPVFVGGTLFGNYTQQGLGPPSSAWTSRLPPEALAAVVAFDLAPHTGVCVTPFSFDIEDPR